MEGCEVSPMRSTRSSPTSASLVATIRSRVTLASVALLLGAGLVAAQSLGEVAREEKKRREQVKTEAKTITNETGRFRAASPGPPGTPTEKPAADKTSTDPKAPGTDP